jgi:predicted Zn-dependent protease
MIALFLMLLANPQGDVAPAQPSNAREWYALGRARVAAASQAYGELLAHAAADSPYVAAVRADGLMRRLQYPRAIAGFRAALSQEPNLVSARAALAGIYRKLGRPDWAAKEEAEIAALDCAGHTIECDFVAGRYQAVLASTAGSHADAALYWRGQAGTGLADEAFRKLEQLPPSAELHEYRAGLFWEADRRLDVVKELREAVKLEPADRALRQNLASALGAAGFYDEAYRMARELLGGAPDSPQLNALAGDALLGSERAEEALPFLKKSVARDSGNPAVQASLGRAYMQIGEPGLALPHLEAAARIDADGSLHHLLATAYQRTGQRKLAEQALEKYRELAARSAAAPAQSEITPP